MHEKLGIVILLSSFWHELINNHHILVEENRGNNFSIDAFCLKILKIPHFINFFIVNALPNISLLIIKEANVMKAVKPNKPSQYELVKFLLFYCKSKKSAESQDRTDDLKNFRNVFLFNIIRVLPMNSHCENSRDFKKPHVFWNHHTLMATIT